MKVLQTESADIKTLEELGWSIKSLNIPVLLVDPPDVPPGLIEVEEKRVLFGDIDFIAFPSGRSIDMLTHRTLLEESLVKHRDIWRTLAEK